MSYFRGFGTAGFLFLLVKVMPLSPPARAYSPERGLLCVVCLQAGIHDTHTSTLSFLFHTGSVSPGANRFSNRKAICLLLNFSGKILFWPPTVTAFVKFLNSLEFRQVGRELFIGPHLDPPTHRKYSRFSLFMVAVFYKVTRNTDLVNTETPRGNTGLYSCKPLVVTFPSTRR